MVNFTYILFKDFSMHVAFKGTVRRYWSRAITHYFTGSEIIT